MKNPFSKENPKLRNSLIFMCVVAVVCCIGVINSRLSSQKSLSVSSGYKNYETDEMKSHNGDVLVDSLNLTSLPGTSEGYGDKNGLDNNEDNGLTKISESPGALQSSKNADSNESADSEKKAGTALVTSDNATDIANTDEYFRESRMTLTEDRNEMISMLTDTIETSSIESEKNSAATQKEKIINYINAEKSIEALIRNKGYTDALVIITDKSVNITIQIEELTNEDAAKILDIAMRETGRNADEIVIQAKSR